MCHPCQGEGPILTWCTQWKKRTVHYFKPNEFHKDLTLCNRVIPGKRTEVNPEEYYRKCKMCIKIICTYDNLDNARTYQGSTNYPKKYYFKEGEN